METIDLSKGIFVIQESDRVPEGLCAIFLDKNCIYAGRIDDSPNPPPDNSVVILSPEDFNSLSEVMKRHTN